MPDRPADSALSSVIQTMSLPQSAPPRAPKVPTALAVVVVLLVAGLGAWFVYRYGIKGTTGPVADVVVLDDAAMRRPGGAGAVSRQRGAVAVRGPDYHLRATRSGDASYSITFDFTPEIRRSWVTPEQWDLHQLAQRATSIPKFARHIKLAPEQAQRLRALSANVELSPADVQKLRPFLSDWDRATDPIVQRSAQGPLLDAAQSVAAAHRPAAQANQRRRVQEIPKIITAEQLKLAETYILPAASAGATTAEPPPSPSSP